MTLTVSGAALRYAGNGTADTFAYQGVVFASSDLAVHLEDADGNADEQTLNVDYTVTGVGLLSGGSVVFTTPPASGETVSISSSVRGDGLYSSLSTYHAASVDPQPGVLST